MQKKSKLKMKDKRAIALGLKTVVVLIVTIGFALIYFMWLNDFRIFGENLSDYTICRNSNIENARGKLKIDNLALSERKGNRCKTEYLDVPKGREKEIIAKKLAGCWDQYLEGKETLFDTEDNNYCAICSVLDFEDKKEITDLTSYLMKKNLPHKPGFTYYQYLNRIKITKEQLEKVENEELGRKLGAVDTGTGQAVLYVEGKDVNPGSLTGESSIVSAGAGGAIGAVAGLVTLIGFGLCATLVGCTLGAFFVAAGAGTTGYLMGSDYDPDIDSRVLLWPYTNQDLRQLECTVLEGQDRLDIKKF